MTGDESAQMFAYAELLFREANELNPRIKEVEHHIQKLQRQLIFLRDLQADKRGNGRDALDRARSTERIEKNGG